MKGFITLLIFTMLHFVAMAKPYNPDNLPVDLHPQSPSYTCNPDNILSPATVDSLNTMLYALEKAKGVKTLVIVVADIEGDDPYEFSIGVGNKYGVGSKQNTGLIVTLATEDRCYYILTGEGLEKHLPDAICKRVENRVMVPLLKQGDWNGAMTATVSALKGILEGDEELVREYTNSTDEDSTIILIAAIMLIVGTFMLFAHVTRQEKKCPHCGKYKLKVISNKTFTDKQGIRHTNTILLCQNCGKQVNREKKEDTNDTGIGGGPFIGGIPMGGGYRRTGGGFGGGGFGSFGGGSFGGGGAGGRF